MPAAVKSTKIVGLTGGIASGKSTISRYIQARGIPVFDADATGHLLMQKDQPAWQDIIDTFGLDILAADGQIDRKKLGGIVFADSTQLKKLEQIMHKRIRQQGYEFIAKHQQQNTPLIVLDVPLLIEAGWYTEVDEVWLVYLNTAEQISRATARDASSIESVKQRIDKQMPYEEKKKFATHIIDNSGTLENTLKQIDELLAPYKN